MDVRRWLLLFLAVAAVLVLDHTASARILFTHTPEPRSSAFLVSRLVVTQQAGDEPIAVEVQSGFFCGGDSVNGLDPDGRCVEGSLAMFNGIGTTIVSGGLSGPPSPGSLSSASFDSQASSGVSLNIWGIGPAAPAPNPFASNGYPSGIPQDADFELSPQYNQYLTQYQQSELSPAERNLETFAMMGLTLASLVTAPEDILGVEAIEGEVLGPVVEAAETATPAFSETVVGSGGRLGSTTTRALNANLAEHLEAQGFSLEGGGGGRLPEEFIPGPGGGVKGGTYVDVTARNGSNWVRIQTIDTLADGVTPTAREAAAAARIRAAFPNHTLILVPKP